MVRNSLKRNYGLWEAKQSLLLDIPCARGSFLLKHLALQKHKAVPYKPHKQNKFLGVIQLRSPSQHDAELPFQPTWSVHKNTSSLDAPQTLFGKLWMDVLPDPTSAGGQHNNASPET